MTNTLKNDTKLRRKLYLKLAYKLLIPLDIPRILKVLNYNAKKKIGKQELILSVSSLILDCVIF